MKYKITYQKRNHKKVRVEMFAVCKGVYYVSIYLGEHLSLGGTGSDDVNDTILYFTKGEALVAAVQFIDKPYKDVTSVNGPHLYGEVNRNSYFGTLYTAEAFSRIVCEKNPLKNN